MEVYTQRDPAAHLDGGVGQASVPLLPQHLLRAGQVGADGHALLDGGGHGEEAGLR